MLKGQLAHFTSVSILSSTNSGAKPELNQVQELILTAVKMQQPSDPSSCLLLQVSVCFALCPAFSWPPKPHHPQAFSVSAPHWLLSCLFLRSMRTGTLFCVAAWMWLSTSSLQAS